VKQLLDAILKPGRAQKISKAFWTNCENTHLGANELYDLQEASINKHLVPLLDAEKSVLLDVGCGDGRFAVQLAPHCKRVDAIDISASQIGQVDIRAKELNIKNITAAVRDVSKSGLDTTYDVIVATGFFTTITEQSLANKLLKLFHQHLAPGGYLVVRDSLKDGPTEVRIIPNYRPNQDYAACYRNREEYKRWYTGSGWTLVAEDHLSNSPDNTLQSVLYVFKK
jgi:cyclopropane fatty-acyl-phospholipid synthase-like methyltransferase